MGLKKYEIITVGSDKRVRALCSWAVGDRYVNIGDVGGIVYDEKTLSQDGACWLFRGNFGFPGARIGGDSIVDVGEAALSTAGAPNIDILGTSVVVGSKIRFEPEQTAADAVVLTADDFEQGGLVYSKGANWETWKTPRTSSIRLKAPIFMGGVSATLKMEVPGYVVQVFVMDRDGIGAIAKAPVITGEGVTLEVPAGQYFMVTLGKDPTAAIVPADATAAQLTFTGTYETKLSIIDSRVEINPATSTAVATIRPGGTYTIASGAKYPEAVIRNSNMSIIVPASTDRVFRLMGRVIGSTATLDGTTSVGQMVGIHSNVKNLTFAGAPIFSTNVSAYSIIQATDCDNFVVSPTTFPGLEAAQTANMPFIFQGCNVPGGRFYHHAKVANTYRDINFDLATKDLGKKTVNGYVMVSSEVEGMYRLYSTAGSLFGALAEAHDSVKSLNMRGSTATYGTTIYADAYLTGLFDFAGTNVFGNKVRSHPLAQVLNVAPRAVQGNLTLKVGQRPSFVPGSLTRVIIKYPIRINTANGITVNNIPAGIQATFACVDGQGNFVVVSTWKEGTATVTNLAQLDLPSAYLMFKKADDSPVTPADLAGVTVMVYNGCKIVNTETTAVPMKGNIRVEDNATLINSSVVGSGYFGGNSIAQGLTVEGVVYMKDNAVFAPTITGAPKANILRMTDNASFTGSWSGAGTRLAMSDNARYGSSTALNTSGVVAMRGNADISGSGTVSVSGVLVLEDDASIAGGNASIFGDITLCGKYKQTAAKTWTGKRTITDVNAPEYDNNVKTQYDF